MAAQHKRPLLLGQRFITLEVVVAVLGMGLQQQQAA
jgi:hypothetical protein